jgi:hypothetical protein
MKMSEIANSLDLALHSPGAVDQEVTGGYVSDLLSDVLANAKSGNIWVTNQKHQNCVAVASLLELAGIVVAGGIAPDDNTVEKAVTEQVSLYTSGISAFEVVGKLYEMGVR